MSTGVVQILLKYQCFIFLIMVVVEILGLQY